MEVIVTYLIYILGIIGLVSILCLTHVKVKQLDTRYDILKMLTDKDYETQNIDLDKLLNDEK